MIIDASLPPKRNRWLKNASWQFNNTIRLEAKNKGDLFYNRNKACKNGHFKRYVVTDKCVECSAKGKADSKKARPEHFKAQKTKHHLKFNYGISKEEYDQLSIKQNNLCAICKLPETSMIKGVVRKLSVDHCHRTDKIRGLLCISCNLAIGKLKHNPELLRKAALYCEQI